MGHDNVRYDCALQLKARYVTGGISRRELITGLTFLGFAAAVPPPALAQSEAEVVVANFGGEATRAMNQAWFEPFMKEHRGIKVRVDGSGPTSGKVKAIVESGRISWDIAERNFHGSLELGPLGMLEEMDYSIVDAKKVLPGYAGKWGLGSYTYANVMVYDTKAFGGRIPKSWADFWNVKEFPGKRTFRKYIDGVLEAALQADGVPADRMYPIDVDRAFKKLRELKPHIIFWNTHAESAQLLREGEVTMGCLASSRAIPLKRETAGRIDYTYNQASAFVSGWAVLKGAPARKNAFDLIASTQDPRRQIEFLRLVGNGPVNPAANDIMPADLVDLNPSNPKISPSW